MITLPNVSHVYYMCDTQEIHVWCLDVLLVHLYYMCKTPVIHMFHTCNTGVSPTQVIHV